MNITKMTSTAKTTVLTNRKIDYIVIHYTAGKTSKAGSAAANARYFAESDAKASADYIVDDSGVVCYNPDIKNRYTWHCGGGRLPASLGGKLNGICRNSNSIGIEMCSNLEKGYEPEANCGGYTLTEAVIEQTAELTRELMKEYGIPADHVVRHYDVTGKLCPGVYGWNKESGDESEWNRFHALLYRSDNYKDPNEPSPWAKEAWQWARSKSIIDGTRPHDPMTREELATVLFRKWGD